MTWRRSTTSTTALLFSFFVGRAPFGIGYAMLGGAIARFALGPQNWMFRCLITRAATCEQP
jgi:hypothetical protein